MLQLRPGTAKQIDIIREKSLMLLQEFGGVFCEQWGADEGIWQKDDRLRFVV